MGIITSIYKKNFLIRFDKDEGIPYYSYLDFPNLICTEGSFNNSNGITIQYYIYNYDNYDKDKLIIFCPGIGPGHTAYLREIETLCSLGYKVLTLDYTGCGSSKGERLPSINTPTKDVLELIKILDIKEEIIPIGHSLGGYTALNTVHLCSNIKKCVILSGFIGIENEMMTFVKIKNFANKVKKYEQKLDNELGSIDNYSYLQSTNDKILWIHSTDDPMVSYEYNAKLIENINNPNITLIKVNNKKHNPQYTNDACDKMNMWISEYTTLVKKKKLKTLENKKAFFNDKPLSEMTEQDPIIYSKIQEFLNA